MPNFKYSDLINAGSVNFNGRFGPWNFADNELSATILLMVWKAIVRSLLSFAHNTGVARERLSMPPMGDNKEERHVEVEITYSVVD